MVSTLQMGHSPITYIYEAIVKHHERKINGNKEKQVKQPNKIMLSGLDNVRLRVIFAQFSQNHVIVLVA